MEAFNNLQEQLNDTLYLLEYNQKKGIWHYNRIEGEKPREKTDTNGFAPIAITRDRKASIFTFIMDCKLHKREAVGLLPYKTEHVKKEWKQFCYVYNFIIMHLEVTDFEKEMVQKFFDPAESLARLGHGGFSDVKEDKDLPWAWEYNPLDFKDSNF